MERRIDIHLEKLPEDFYLATSSSLQGLIAQGRTITKPLEIARDVAKKLLEAQSESEEVNLQEFGNEFEYPLVVGI